MKEQYIKWKQYPPDHAREADKAGYYIEAVQVLHGWVEAKLRELLIMSRHGNIKGDYSQIWDVAEEMGFNVLVRALLVNGKINKKEYNELQAFNSLRNRLVHKLFYEPYDKDYPGVPMSQYQRVFKEGLKLGEKLGSRSEYVLNRRKG